MSKYQRDKGKRGELEIVHKYRKIFPDAKRHLEMQMQECFGVDLDNTGDQLVQVKNWKGYVPINKIDEIKEVEGKHKVLWTKASKKPWLVVTTEENYLLLLEKATKYDKLDLNNDVE